MRLIVVVCGWLFVASLPAQAGVRLDVLYREPADAFEIMDSVSQWWPDYNVGAYRKAWADSFGITTTDSELFTQYAQIRDRYYDKSGQQDEDPRVSRSGLFTDRAVLDTDPLAYAFYRAETMDEAFAGAAKVVAPPELAFLRSFYAHYSEPLGRLTAQTRRSVAASRQATEKALGSPAVASYLAAISGFFGVTEDVGFTALYVWWPDQERIAANPNGRFLVLRVRPVEGETLSSADLVVHEAVHQISAMQADDRKRAVSDAVLASCPGVVERAGRLGTLEEPLATILGNMEFRRRFEPRRFSWGRSWYGDPWVDLMARLLYPVVMEAMQSGRGMDAAFTKDAAALCKTAMGATGER